MIQIADRLISEDIFSKNFICNLSKCKGACCVEGDLGAPLDKEETKILESLYEKILPYLSKEGIETIEKKGKWEIDPADGEYVTPTIDGRECVYVTYDENHVTKCAIEKAYEEGAVDWQKPISCHLYPIRVTEYKTFTALNYHSWSICKEACALGNELQISIFRFLKVPLIRKYGETFYEHLCQAEKEWEREFGKS
ncbi:MAG: DUF3109 family protein [Bergeyella sp.]|nr:DUF3109 family protein [Bergeyella sp.]